jgi:hypothetical protein
LIPWDPRQGSNRSISGEKSLIVQPEEFRNQV